MGKKKVLVFITNPIRSPYKNDQYDSFRSEGRYSMNIGFGLSLLGFDVNIVMHEWNPNYNRQVWDNVYLSDYPMYNHYDYILTWSIDQLKIKEFDKAIFMDWAMIYVNQVSEYINKYINNINNKKGKKIIYVSPTKYFIKYAELKGIKFPIPVEYFPALFPIPSINVGFVKYNSNGFSRNENVLKIYIYYNPEKMDMNRYVSKQKTIIDYIRNKFEDKKTELFIHTGSRECKKIFDADKINYLYELETRYIDIINAISSSDLCIIPGSNSSGPCLADSISLGKPVIFISDSYVTTDRDLFGNCIFEYPEYIFYVQESDIETNKKLDLFIKNPKESYDKFKDAHKDINFDNWKEFAKKYFIL